MQLGDINGHLLPQTLPLACLIRRFYSYDDFNITFTFQELLYARNWTSSYTVLLSMRAAYKLYSVNYSKYIMCILGESVAQKRPEAAELSEKAAVDPRHAPLPLLHPKHQLIVRCDALRGQLLYMNIMVRKTIMVLLHAEYGYLKVAVDIFHEGDMRFGRLIQRHWIRVKRARSRLDLAK